MVAQGLQGLQGLQGFQALQGMPGLQGALLHDAQRRKAAELMAAGRRARSRCRSSSRGTSTRSPPRPGARPPSHLRLQPVAPTVAAHGGYGHSGLC